MDNIRQHFYLDFGIVHGGLDLRVQLSLPNDIERQKRCKPAFQILQVLNRLFRIIFTLHDDVLARSTESRVEGGDVFRLCIDQFTDRSDDTIQLTVIF